MALFLDALLIVLLVTVIGFCVMLDRRLRLLRRNEGQLRDTLAAFAASAADARRQLAELREASGSTLRRLEDGTRAAGSLRDELDLMIGSGERLAERLDGVISFSRARDRMGPDAGGDPRPNVPAGAPSRRSAREIQAPASGDGFGPTEAERELRRALKAGR